MTDIQRSIQTVGRGGNPPWTATFIHHQYGELTFTAELPTAKALLQHSIAMDNYLSTLNLDAEPRGATMVLASAIAGLKDNLLVQCPVVGEDQEEDEETGRVVLTRRFYDPEADDDVAFIAEVWLAFSAWRTQLLTPEAVRSLGESSAGTTGGESDESSSSASASPSTIPA